ncbi:MAG: OmpA family protein [Bacteroidota bacterium]
MRKFNLLIVAALLLSIGSLTAQNDTPNKWGVGIRYIAPNYFYPLESVDNLILDDFGGGLQFEFQRYLSDAFFVAVPLHISRAERQLVSSSGMVSRRGIASVGADLTVGLEPIPGQSWFDPQLFAGIGLSANPSDATTAYLPLGLNLNFRLGRSVWFSPRFEYRMALGDDEGLDIFQIGAGIFLREGEPKENPDRDGDGIANEADACPDNAGPVALLGCPDADGDNIADKDDRCPTEAGPAATQGCPDADGDGVADSDDDCPDVAGLVALRGCPDRDGDGITDADDECPDVAGIASNNGCPPMADADGDGVADDEDRCPTEAGSAALYGCPDSDGDGIANGDDDCPDEAGPRRFNGCPDTDGDGVANPDDRCPTEAGPVDNLGCPEIAEEDITTIEFAIQNVNFETSSANLTATSRGVLDQIVDIMNRYPAYSLGIGGHTDSIGDAESNQRLSERRAESVYNYLVGQGVAADRMSFEGYGETQPIGDNRYRDGREQNRRVEFNLVVE